MNNTLNDTQTKIIEKIGKWMSDGSGWAVDEVISHYMNSVKYEPLKGSSYIDLRKELKILPKD